MWAKQHSPFRNEQPTGDCRLPWVVIPVERRDEYMAALEQASVERTIEGLLGLLSLSGV